MYLCAIVTSQSLRYRRQMNSSNFKGTWHTLCMKTLQTEDSVPKRKATLVVWNYFGYKKDDIDQTCVLWHTSVPHSRVLHGSYFANPHPPIPAVLKTASDPFSNSSTNYILLELTRYKLIPTRTQRNIRRTQVLKMKVSQRREWEFREGTTMHEWAHMKYKCS